MHFTSTEMNMPRLSNFLLSAIGGFVLAGIPACVSAQDNAAASAVQQGQAAFQANCAFCHGSQAMGTEQAPSLVRSPLVRKDVNGDALTPMIKAGRPTLGMPAFASLPPAQISNIIAFLHVRASQARGHRVPETALLVGDAKQGKAYFRGAGGCSGCHSVTGDLAHIGGKYSPLSLMVNFLTPAQRPLKGKVTLLSGKTASGTVEYIDEFTLSLVDHAGNYQTWSRDKLESVNIVNPLAAHQEMLAKYTDADIHNLLAYLVTLR